MNKYLLATVFGAIAATSVQAIENQKTVCTHGNQTRVIEVVYLTEDSIPCEVRYSKEEGTKTLWHAYNVTGYCEEKAAEFAEKQQAWGWNCDASSNTATTDETEVAASEEAEAAPITSEPEASTIAEAAEAAPVAE
jgi:hypothetical protein